MFSHAELHMGIAFNYLGYLHFWDVEKDNYVKEILIF